VLGGASAVGPILLGLAKPVALLQNDGTVEDIVNMTAYTVTKAQQQDKRAELKRA
jgi:malate dehydrogenase (oxaloacetate-decarboxylating)(NADP+)